MARAKKDDSEKVKKEPASAKLSKEMKAEIEKIFEKQQKQSEKRFSTIEKQLEKLKGAGAPKSNAQKISKKAQSTKAKKKGSSTKKKMREEDHEAE